MVLIVPDKHREISSHCHNGCRCVVVTLHLANEALVKSESFKSQQQLFKIVIILFFFIPSFFSEAYFTRIWTIVSLSKEGYYTNADFILSGKIRQISKQTVVLCTSDILLVSKEKMRILTHQSNTILKDCSCGRIPVGTFTTCGITLS